MKPTTATITIAGALTTLLLAPAGAGFGVSPMTRRAIAAEEASQSLHRYLVHVSGMT